MLIKTARTQLEVFGPEHAECAFAYSVDNRAHLDLWEPQRAADYYTLESFAERGTNSQREWEQGVALKLVAMDAERRMVASCNFTNITRGPMQACNLGYSIDQFHQGQGLMSEVVAAALAHVFDELDLHRVMANYQPTNERSARVLERLGFEKEGLARSYLKIAGVWSDHILTAKINPNH